MKIALLAPSRAGKTAYLTVLHNVLSRELSNSSYGIDFTISDSQKRAHLEKRYKNLLRNKDFGEGSQRTIIYPLTMTTHDSHGDPRSLNVEIVDFPGGFLHDIDGHNEQAVEETRDALAECDGFIVLLDGNVLAEGMTAMRKERRFIASEAQPDSVQNILKSALERHRTEAEQRLKAPNAYAFGKGPIPVVFALTKADQVEALGVQHPNFDRDLTLTVKRQFTPTTLEYYDPKTGSIPNLISSQYGKILKMSGKQVVTLRTDTSVYNQVDEVIEPRNPEHLLQFVIFQGLRNAVAEYERRISGWQRDRNKKSREQRSEIESFEAVDSQYRRQSLPAAVYENVASIFTHKSTLKERRARYHADAVTATRKFNRSSGSLRQVENNLETAELFLERILSDKLVHMVTHGRGKGSLHQKGLPIANLSDYAWWRKKSRAGAEIIKQEKQLEVMWKEPT